IYWIFSAAVSAMPEPAPCRAWASRPEPASNGSAGYLWLYRFCHTTAGNITTAFKNRIPGLKVLLPPLIVPLLCATTACASLHYTVHPAALNTVVQSYNVARESWLTYRGAVATNAPSDAYLTQLNNNLLDLSKAIQALKEGQK
ncbi:MAG: hypothetical protein ACREIF_19615, partial [Chthoniobacterales bacterium]